MNFIFSPETKGACEQRRSQGACKGGEFGSYYVLCGFSVTFSTSSARSGANVHQYSVSSITGARTVDGLCP